MVYGNTSISMSSRTLETWQFSLKYSNWYLKVKDRFRWLACGLPPVHGEVIILDTTQDVTVTLTTPPLPGQVITITVDNQKFTLGDILNMNTITVHGR